VDGPGDRLIQSIVAPKQFAVAGEKSRGTEDTVRRGRFCLRAKPILNLGRGGARQSSLGIDADAF
jgi:hypothetical protein